MINSLFLLVNLFIRLADTDKIDDDGNDMENRNSLFRQQLIFNKILTNIHHSFLDTIIYIGVNLSQIKNDHK